MEQDDCDSVDEVEPEPAWPVRVWQRIQTWLLTTFPTQRVSAGETKVISDSRAYRSVVIRGGGTLHVLGKPTIRHLYLIHGRVLVGPPDARPQITLDCGSAKAASAPASA